MRTCALLLCAVTMTAACAERDDAAARAWTGVIDTIGGVVRVTNPAAGVWADGEEWRLEPLLRIGGGAAAGDPSTFGSISAIEVGSDGRVYVLDRQANELRIFGADGSHVRSVGRSGSGPAEFKQANGLQWLGDTLVVIDGSGSRYTLFDREGALLRTVPRPLQSYGWSFQGGADRNMLYESGLAIARGGYRSAIFGVRLDAAPVMADTIEFPPHNGVRMQPFEVTTATGSSSISVPFFPGPAWHMNGDGTLWYGHGSEYRIQRLSLDGDTLSEIVSALSAAPVTPADLAAWEQQRHVQQFRELGGNVDASRIPRAKPFFREMFSDDEGFLWVEPLTESSNSSFDVFDDEGRFHGRLTTMLRREPTVKPIVRGDRMYIVSLDSNDVPAVEVLSLRR